MNRKVKITSLMISVIMLLSLMGCASITPEEAVTESLQNYKDKNFAYFATQEEMKESTKEEFNTKTLEEKQKDFFEYVADDEFKISEQDSNTFMNKFHKYDFTVGEAVILDDKVSGTVPVSVEYYDIDKSMEQALEKYENEVEEAEETIELDYDEEIQKMIKIWISNDVKSKKDIDVKVIKVDKKWILDESIDDIITEIHDL